MAIKIIDPNPAPEVLRTVICRNCGVKLQFTPNDVRTKTVSDYTGDKESFHYISCPNCYKDVGTGTRF